MTLGELFERLAYGELSQHRYSVDGVIQQKDYPALIIQLNAALSNLHTTLPLKVKELILRQYADITEYHLDPKYALSNTSSGITNRYILDTKDDPFTRTVVRINSAFDHDGYPIPMNDEFDSRSWFTASYDLVQIPFPEDGQLAVLLYQANHEKIPTATTDLTTLVDIPISLEEALCAFIAGRCYVSLGNATSAQLSNYYMTRYQQQLDHVKRENLFSIGEVDSNIKLGLRGFV